MGDLRGGGSVGYVICDGNLVGAFSLSDDCRTGAVEAIQELRSMGIKTVMLTGDSRAAATYAQAQLGGGLEELHSELLPEDKVRLIRNLKAASGPTLMVGDGMNDAPALAAADVGVSMGLSGSAAAMETSHATLMSSDILRVPAAVRLGRRTRRTVAVNVVGSVAAKAAVLALAVAWRPVLWAAVLADVGTCLLVVLHSMTLLGEPWTMWRRSGEVESCRATARSLALRSQLAEASNAASASVQRKREESKSCGYCKKQNKSPEHSVVIDVPAPAAARSSEQHKAIPRAKEKGKITGCCGAGKSCAVSMVPPPTAVPAAGEGDDSDKNVKTPCCNKQRSECGSLVGK
jgi:Zn2+/Cd2+-exporting ATPase